MKSLEQVTEWIAGDGRWAGGLLRLCALGVGSVGVALATGHGKGRLDIESILLGLVTVLLLGVPFALWRFTDLRRQAQRRRDKAIRPLDLE
jgi:hypothetical protein